MIDLTRTRFIVTAWPDNCWPVEIYAFIEKLMDNVEPLRQDYRQPCVKADRTCARNTAIETYALGAPKEYEWFVFIDKDVRPTINTPQFLSLTTDIKACQVPMNNAAAWCRPTSYHEAIWCASRRVLEQIEPPWFMQRYNATGTEMDGCICDYFRQKALDAGFTISHGGWAEHDRNGSWCG